MLRRRHFSAHAALAKNTHRQIARCLHLKLRLSACQAATVHCPAADSSRRLDSWSLTVFSRDSFVLTQAGAEPVPGWRLLVSSIQLPIWVSGGGGEKSARPAANVGQLINSQLQSDIKGRGVTNAAQFTPTFLSPLDGQKGTGS